MQERGQTRLLAAGGGRGERSAALAAEFFPQEDWVPTARASKAEPCATFFTEFDAGSVGCSALCTLHAPGLSPWWRRTQ